MGRREDLIQLLGEFLARIRESGDPEQALAPSATAVAADLARSMDEESSWDIEARLLLGWLTWYRAEALPAEQRRTALDDALEILGPIATGIGVLEFPEPLLPALADRVVPTLGELLEYARLNRDTRTLSNAIDCLAHVLAATPEGRPEFAYRLSMLGGALLIRYQQAGDREDLDGALTAARRSARLGAGDRDLDAYLLNLCGILKTRYALTRNAADLDEAVDAGRRAVAAARAENQSAALTNLNGALLDRFELTGRPEDLSDGIDLARRAVALADPADPHRPAILHNLAKALHESVDHGGPAEDLAEAEQAARQAVRAGAGHPDEEMFLSNLVRVLRAKFERTGGGEDLDEAIMAERRLVSITRVPNVGRLLTLAAHLADRFDRDAELTDLEEMVTLNRRAVEAEPDSAMTLVSLATVLLAWYARTRAVADLDETIAVARRAVELAGPADPSGRANALRLLERALWTLFELSGESGDLDEVVATRRALVEATPAGDAERAQRLSRLGQGLLLRFEKDERTETLDEAVDTMRAALRAAASETDRWYRRADLCGVLIARYTRRDSRSALDEAADIARDAAGQPTDDAPAGVLLNFAHVLDQRARVAGALDDLDTAIAFVRRAASATAGVRQPGAAGAQPYVQLLASDIWPDTWPERTAGQGPEHADVVRLLGAYVMRRFEWTEVLADVDEAIRIRREQLARTAGDVEQAKRLMSLSYALKARFTRSGEPADLDEAVETGQRAMELDPGNAAYLTSTSNTLHARAGLRGDVVDFDDAVAVARRAAEASTGANGPGAWANLAAMLLGRAERNPYSTDLDESLAAARHAVAIGERAEFDRPKWLFALAQVLNTWIRRATRPSGRPGESDADRDGVEAARSEALGVIAELVHATTAPPRLRVRGAVMGALLAVDGRLPGTDDPTLAADLLETVVRLGPEIATRRMSHREQREAIGMVADLADNAAAVALAAEDRPAAQRVVRALSLLEAGRSVLLNQLMDVRGDLTDLRRVRPQLAERFTALRDFLDAATDPVARTRDGTDRIGAATELAATLREIRTLDGFASFALPPTEDELLAAAGEGPIVSFTLAYHGTALLLTKDGITSLPLPGVTQLAVIDRVNAFYVALDEAYDPAADRVAAQRTLTDVLKWLWDTVTGPVLDALGYRATPADGTPWPRLWWAPGGYLGLLPLHAAGHHDDPDAARTVMDRVVSSYTPTVRTLRHARQRRMATAPDRSLIVAMPTTPGQAELRNVRTETELLAEILPGPLVLTEPDRPRVLAELPTSRIAHFACHGSYAIENPESSGLLLRDHERNPLTVGEVSAVNLDGAQLAYLSACHTAVNTAQGLRDEALHLAGALQAAGFPQVVGTLWEVDDEVAVDITGDFYRGLRAPDTESLHLGGAARSLHRAVRAQRDEYPGTPSLWASHLHFGT
jgi:CHAT domain-containing protein